MERRVGGLDAEDLGLEKYIQKQIYGEWCSKHALGDAILLKSSPGKDNTGNGKGQGKAESQVKTF